MRLLYECGVRDEGALVLLRTRLRAVSRRMGFSATLREKMELVCNEMVTNQIKFAGGSGVLQLWETRAPDHALELFALDYGPGIEELPQALQDGYTTAGTMGKGLGALMRLPHAAGIYTLTEADGQERPWHGVAVWARFLGSAQPAPGRFEYGCFLRAYQDDCYNGDAIWLREEDGRLGWLHMDGLGHGRQAAEAVAGMEDLLDNPAPLAERIKLLSGRLNGERGAVALLGEVDADARQLRVSGIGDMHAALICNGERRSIGFSPGILGHAHRSAELVELGFPPQALLISASDGVRSSWGLNLFPGLWRLHPQLIALFLGYVLGRRSDDKSLVVVRTRQRQDNNSRECA